MTKAFRHDVVTAFRTPDGAEHTEYHQGESFDVEGLKAHIWEDYVLPSNPGAVLLWQTSAPTPQPKPAPETPRGVHWLDAVDYV